MHLHARFPFRAPRSTRTGRSSRAARRRVQEPPPGQSWRPGIRLLVVLAAVAIVVGMALSVAQIVAGEMRQTAVDSARRSVDALVRGDVDPNPIGGYEVYQNAQPIEDRVTATQEQVFYVALVASSGLLGLLWLAFAGASRLLGRQNRLLRERAATEQLLMADVRRSEERFRSLIR